MSYFAEASDLTAPFIAVPVESGADIEQLGQHQIKNRPQQQGCDRESSAESEFCVSDIALNLALHVLLCTQFGIFFWFQDAAVADLSWAMVNGSIAMYLVTTYLYRECLHWAGVSYDLPMLLPEIMIVFTMGLCCFYDVLPAFLVLILTKLCLAVFVVLVNLYRLMSDDNGEENGDQQFEPVIRALVV